MAGLATERINEIYRELEGKFGHGKTGITPLELEILAIKNYLDEQNDLAVADLFPDGIPNGAVKPK